jgi:hypothetical protein
VNPPQNTTTTQPSTLFVLSNLAQWLLTIFLGVIVLKPEWLSSRTADLKRAESQIIALQEGQVVRIVMTGNYNHPASGREWPVPQVIVSDAGGMQYVVHTSDIITFDIPPGTTHLIKVVHNGQLKYSPWRTETVYAGKGEYDSYSSDYSYSHDTSTLTDDQVLEYANKALKETSPRPVEPLTPEPANPPTPNTAQ